MLETWQPFFHATHSRIRHAAHNLTIALVNLVTLAICFGAVTVYLIEINQENDWALLNYLSLPTTVELVLAVLLIDAWMYLWHRMNHNIPLLWRFHRMHHSDNQMDVTSATRFHLGEHLISAILRLGLILLLGLSLWQLTVYKALMVFTTQLHHANISLGRWDAILRWLIVTPDMHKVHHSREKDETNSNYSVVFSFWDRIGQSFKLRKDPLSIQFGLEDYDEEQWQTFWGMFKTPWRK